MLEGKVWGEINPEAPNKGLGGRETALVSLSQQWAAFGHHVQNFVHTTRPQRFPHPSGGEVEYIDITLAPHYLNATYNDVVIAWEHEKLFSFKDVAQNVKAKIIGMQVAHFDLEPESYKDVDAFVVLSPWAAQFLKETFNLPHPFYVVPNGVDLGRYPTLPDPTRRHSNQFFYSSSPDRGLIHLLRAWPRVRTELPKAELFVAYGARRWVNQLRWTHYMQGDVALEIEHLLNQPGVQDVGLIGQDELALLQMQCALLPYPCDTMSPTETGCITVTEALAAMAPVVTTDCDCLKSEYESVVEISPLPYDEDDFLARMFTILNDEDRYLHMQIAGREFAEARSWQSTASQWMDVIRGLLVRA